MVPNLIGNMPNWKKIHKIARKYNLITIEDSADTIGYRYKKNLKKNFSDISTTSFFCFTYSNMHGEWWDGNVQ